MDKSAHRTKSCRMRQSQRRVAWSLPHRLLYALLGFYLLGCSNALPRTEYPHITFDLRLLNGAQIHSADLQGRTIVVNFWASWCQPCLEEMPELQRVWQAYHEHGVVFLGVVLHNDDIQAVQAFLQAARIAYPHGHDEAGKLAASFQVVGLPNTFIVNKEGRLMQRFIGPVTEARLRMRLQEILAL